MEGNLVNTTQYEKSMEKMIYLSHTWPNIAFALSLVSQFMHSTTQNILKQFIILSDSQILEK